MKKKLIILIVLVLAILILTAISVNAADIISTETTKTSTGISVSWKYTLNADGAIEDLRCNNISQVNGNLTIPSTIDGHTVLGIAHQAFTGCTGLTGITFPNTITKIGVEGSWDGAFEGCTGLTSLTFPNSVTAIGGSAFQNCPGIKTIKFSSNLSSIGNYAFEGCTGIETLAFPEGLTQIGEYVFRKCAGIKSVSFPKTLTSIGASSFYECTGIKKIVLPNALTKISQSTFDYCSSLSDVTLPTSLTTLEDRAFGNCVNLKVIELPESVSSLLSAGYGWSGVFNGCKNLKKIKFNNDSTFIGKNTFGSCEKVTIYGKKNSTAQEYASENNISYKDISLWDQDDAGQDISAPTVKSMAIQYGSVSDYYASKTKDYRVPTGKRILIDVEFNENVKGTAPTLTIKIGQGKDIALTKGTISGAKIVYEYTITKNDSGLIAVSNFSGGKLTDEAGNAAILSKIELKTSAFSSYVYADNTVENVAEQVEKETKTETQGETKKESKSETTAGTKKETTTAGTTTGTKTTSAGTKTTTTSSSVDTTTAKGKMPQTGESTILGIAFGIVTLIGIFVYHKNKEFSDIK